MTARRFVPLVLLALSAGCASLGALGQVLRPPTFEVAPGRQAELRLLGPSLQRPLGGAEVRLWTRIGNPNPFALVLSAVEGSLALEGTEAADVSFPLGLPLGAAQDTVIPLDIGVSFANLPALAELLPTALGRGGVDYRFRGSFSVDAGVLGRPSFGPMTLLEGQITTRR